MKQMSLFEDMGNLPDKQPIPVDIARMYSFDLQRYETDEGMLYSVHDWITGVAESDNPRVYWSQMKRRAKSDEKEVFTACKQLPYRTANGKEYQMDFASEVTLYFITQRMESSTRVNQILILFSKYLAQASKDRQNPGDAAARYQAQERRRLLAMGKDEDYINARRESAVERNVFTEAAKQYIFNLPGYGYARLTDEEYLGLFERTARQLKESTGLKNARDGMTRQALNILTTVEGYAAAYFKQRGSISFEEACQALREMGEEMRPMIESMQRRLGIDIATGKPLLSDGR